MRYSLILASSFLSFSAFADTINSNINWQDLSNSPSVNQQVIEQDFVPFNEEEKSSLIQDELANFDFLNKEIDERVFYSLKADLRVLNKYTDKVTEHSVRGIEPLLLGKYNAVIKSCAIAPINNVDNSFAYLEVYKKDILVFNGWLSNLHKNLVIPEIKELSISLVDCQKVEEEVKPEAQEPEVTLPVTEVK